MLNALIGLLTTIVNVYTARRGHWAAMAVLTASITGVAVLVMLSLFAVYDVWLLQKMPVGMFLLHNKTVGLCGMGGYPPRDGLSMLSIASCRGIRNVDALISIWDPGTDSVVLSQKLQKGTVRQVLLPILRRLPRSSVAPSVLFLTMRAPQP
jgi:hypothetical protein